MERIFIIEGLFADNPGEEPTQCVIALDSNKMKVCKGKDTKEVVLKCKELGYEDGQIFLRTWTNLLGTTIPQS